MKGRVHQPHLAGPSLSWATMTIVKPALLYFAVVFAMGFALGTIRVLLVVPLVGERTAELAEMPLMLGVIVLAARWVVRVWLPDRSFARTLAVGLSAAGLVLLADVGVGVGMRGMTLGQIFLERDPIAGAAYYVGLLVFALMPLLLSQVYKEL